MTKKNIKTTTTKDRVEKRAVLDDGRWFDLNAVTESYEEGTRWDGHNHVSLNAGGDHCHEQLYRTAKGKWVISYWSQWQGSLSGYREITAEEAGQWLIVAGQELPQSLAAFGASLEI